MAHNPYAPPTSIVADAAASPPPARPWQIKAILGLILLSFLIGMISLVMDPEIRALGGLQGTVLAVVGTFILVFVGLLAVVVACIWRAHRWARIVYAVLCVLGLVTEVRGLIDVLGMPGWYFPLYLLSVSVDTATLVLLFVPATNAWFGAMRAARLAR